MELRESLKAKSEEGDAFIAEIEVSYPSFPPSLWDSDINSALFIWWRIS